ncbi:hypothetical protein MRX96_035443 [Rhipicephalus microplus]
MEQEWNNVGSGSDAGRRASDAEKMRYSVSVQKEPKRKYTITRNHKCEVCGKALTSHARLQRHLATYACEKPYACPYCPATFARKFNLDEHLLTHTGEKSHGCPACSKMFARRWGVAAHFRVHTRKAVQMPPLPG